MSKLKITREIRLELQKIADKLPAILAVKKASYLWKGSDLLLTPIKSDPETGDKIEPDKYYHITGPGFIEVDHYSEMEAVFKIGGVRSVNDYVQNLANTDRDSLMISSVKKIDS